MKTGVKVAISAALPVGVAGLIFASVGTGPGPVPYLLSAAITESNTTVGFADSDIIGMSTADINKTLDEMQSLGVQNVRILLPWNNIEPAPGYWNWSTVDTLVNAAAERNMGILGVLNATPAWAVQPGYPAVAAPPADNAQYAQFVSAVAERYAGKVSAYEVWNEPNAAPSWYPTPDPAAYTRLLQAAYPAIKAADPNATVIGGVVGWVTDTPGLAINAASYVQGMYDNGAQGYFDALSFHPYQYQVPFGNGTPYGPMAPINQLATIHQEMVAAGDGSKQIWATEYGEPTSVVDNNTQAAFISNFLNSWSSINYTGPMFIYTTRDRNTGSTSDQDTLGVFQTDWTPKPAANVIAQWTATHPQKPIGAPDPTTVPSPTAAMTTLSATTNTLAGQALSTTTDTTASGTTAAAKTTDTTAPAADPANLPVTVTPVATTAPAPATSATATEAASPASATPVTATPVTAAASTAPASSTATPKALAPTASTTTADTAAPVASTQAKPSQPAPKTKSAPTNSAPKNTGPRNTGPKTAASTNK
ncbi:MULTISPECIES: cellulase family glycosylhydrolase [unclassified Mycobacterium]|uniref:cellulase family glycosylhydrolase n=1 Tax=unclassified Mycobacterium TaxID=2642494 RepID=UPI00048C36FE|nr:MULTISPECIES: cellulase family glycosylhydrolase [unclassified Mycobacterium]SEB06803.1 Cellulase (glycosyl hydrolase family 5) [Mycobacterium sp. 283mftsu]